MRRILVNNDRLTLFLFITGSFLFVELNYRYWYLFLEQYMLFQRTGMYFTHLLKQPGGFNEYITEFVTQAFFWPCGAAFVLSFLLGGLACLFLRFTRLCGVRMSLWMALLPFFLFWIFPPESVAGLLAVGFALGLANLYVSLRSLAVRSLAGFVMITVAYFLAVPAHYILAALMLVYECSAGKHRATCWIAFGAVLWSLLLPLLAMRTLYVVPMREAFLSKHLYHPERPIPFSFWIIWLSFPVLSGLAYRCRERIIFRNERIKQRVLYVVLLVGMILGIFYGKHPMEQAYRYDYYARNNQWKQIVEHAAKYRVKDKDALVYLNLALSHTGQLSDRFLEFPQIGEEGLIPHDPTTRLGLIETSEVAWRLGHVNSAQRFAFVGVLSSERCIQPRLMKRLVETYLVNGEYKAAAKYIRILESTFNYTTWAQKHRMLLDAAVCASTDWVATKRKQNALTDNPADLTRSLPDALAFLIDDHGENHPAFDYGMVYLLLHKDIGAFMHYMELRKERQEVLPVYYQEAICLYFAAVKSNLDLFHAYPIAPEVYKRFLAFVHAAKSASPPALKSQFGDTYYYYAQFAPTPKQQAL